MYPAHIYACMQSIVIVALIVLILAALVYKPEYAVFGAVALGAIFLSMCRARKLKKGAAGGSEEVVLAAGGDSGALPGTPAPQNSPCEEHRPIVPPLPTAGSVDRNERLEDFISRSNLTSLNELYGRRTAGTIDNALYTHKQRIGDRDRQATIAQVRSRRNNVYEPYFRQELSEHNSKRWWEPDDVLAVKLERRQLNTLDMNRHLPPLRPINREAYSP